MLKKSPRKKELPRKYGIRHHLVLILFFLIFPFALALLLPAAHPEPILADTQMMFEKTANTTMASPGDRLNFSINYSNSMSETVYNVTIFEWMPAGLSLISSTPFYDGASDPETGFYRWSRGNVAPGHGGTIVVETTVNNIPVGTVITNTAYLAYENGIRVEVTSSVNVTVTQAAGVEVYPDQIHSMAPFTSAETEYNITVRNTGNGVDTFNISLASVAYNPSGASHEWTIELYDPVGYSQDEPVVTLYDNNVENRSAWTDHGVVANVTLVSQQSTWYVVRVVEAEGTSGS
ncbi:MAG: DUF11 domain-containing protein, partial [Anaerolineales bacterium]|nr:DUF11 domain-containing protein [Anaerolineales bacterium]